MRSDIAAWGSDADHVDLVAWDALRAGDEAAFERLFRAHAASLCDFALSYLREPDAAEEVVHALFCWLWEHRFTLPTPKSVRAYLFVAVRNRSRNHLRDETVKDAFMERLASANASTDVSVLLAPDAAFDRDDRAARVRYEVSQLPTRCREVVVLVRYHGMSQAEAAAVLEIAPKTVEVHMGRAMKMLRERLR